MLRFSIAIAVFNAIVTYMPFTGSRFAHFYGYGNLDTVFYFAVPAYLIVKFNHCSVLKRIGYAFLFLSFYTTFKMFYIREYNQELKDFYQFYFYNNLNKLV
jgi:hypothetical protein